MTIANDWDVKPQQNKQKKAQIVDFFGHCCVALEMCVQPNLLYPDEVRGI